MTANQYLAEFAIITPWAVGLLAATVVVLHRCRDRWAAVVAAAGLILVLFASLGRSNLHNMIRDVGLLQSQDTYSTAYNIGDFVYRYLRPAGFALVIAAAFVGRRVTAPRSP